MGGENVAKAGVLQIERRADIDRVIARILPRLAAAEEKTMSGGEFRRAMRDVSRELLEEAMAVLADEGRIVATEVEYHGQIGLEIHPDCGWLRTASKHVRHRWQSPI